MIKRLARFFIEDYERTEDPQVQAQYISLSGALGLVLNIILFMAKLVVGLASNSVALVSDSFNNLSDSLTSVVAIIGSAASRKPADRDHPQGHGRIEYVASLIVGILIIIMGIQLFLQGFDELRNPTPTSMSLAFILVLLISNLVKVYMYSYNKALAQAFNSSLNEGVALDSLSDTIATTGIFLAGLISYFTGLKLDGLVSLIIAILVFKTGLDFTRETVSTLIGERPSKELEEGIGSEIRKGRHVKGYHDLYVHDYGRGNVIAHAHVEVPADLTVKEMHDSIDEIEKKVEEKYGVDLVLHTDPMYFSSEMEEGGMTRIVDLNRVKDPDKYLEEAGQIIQAGGLVVLPTETVYGLAGDGLNPEAVDKIYKVKARPRAKPLILHIDEIAWLAELALDIPDQAYDLAQAFWPGPLTLVLKKSDLVPDIVTAGSDTVGIRMPSNPTIRAVIKEAASPLATPSANLSGRPSPTNAVDAYEDMRGRVPLILDEGSTELGIESTIVDLTQEPRILRLGYFEMEEIRDIIPGIKYAWSGNPVYIQGQTQKSYQTQAEISLYSHNLKDLAGRMQEDARAFKDQGHKVGLLVSDENASKLEADKVFNYGSTKDKEEIARVLFARLRDLDRTGVDKILVQGIDNEGMGQAIMARLLKAAGNNFIRK